MTINRLQLAVATLALLLIGAALCVFATVILRGKEARGELVQFGSTAAFDDEGETPSCNEHHHSCISHDGDGNLIALYTYDTAPGARERGCTAPWRPTFLFINAETGEGSRGWFRSGCTGTTYDTTGQRVYGPGQRSMDRFKVTVADGRVFVDTRHLICGDGSSESCKRAPIAG